MQQCTNARQIVVNAERSVLTPINEDVTLCYAIDF